MKKYTFLLLVVAHASFASAQVISTATDNAALNSFSKTDAIRAAQYSSNSRPTAGFDNRYEGVQGTQFLFDEWLDGTLTLNDSAVVRDKMKYKFELVNNTIWLKMATGEERILYNRELMSLEIQGKNGQNYLIKKVKLPDMTEKNHFSIVLFEGEGISLIKDVKKVFRKANLEDKGIVTVGKAYDWFEEVSKYYLRKGNITEEINLKKSKLISIVPKSHEKMVEQFCKDNDINGKLTDWEAAKLLKYISSLK